jgi:hypothetical protein
MRADAARNLDAVLPNGARLLDEDPAQPSPRSAAEGGVDRRTVCCGLPRREALLRALPHTRLDEVDKVCADARLREAPIAVALQRFVEGIHLGEPPLASGESGSGELLGCPCRDRPEIG